MSDTSPLEEIIIGKIERHGPISFRDFMEMSLYYPGLGYYNSASEKIGKNGDYYTSPYLTDLFGEMIAKQLEEMWVQMGKGPFTLVEYGAGPGSLCLDILQQLKSNRELYENLNYCIIEKSEFMRQQEQSLLHEKVQWCNSISEIAGFNGCVLANEVADNFAVHQVVMQEQLMEVFVGYDHGFFELLQPASASLKNYMDELGVELTTGFRTEINLEALEWISQIATALQKGFLINIDYGATSAELYSEQRSAGTLLCYHQHSINDSLYSNVGRQDITAHVNFSALAHFGKQHGFECAGFTSQSNFLLSLGLTNRLRELEQQTENGMDARSKKLLLLQNFLMDMGRKIKVLVLQKGMNHPLLSGLQFAKRIF